MANTLSRSRPSISALMSCFNGARWLDSAIRSVLDQSLPVDEFVIVDDGSYDDSSAIIEKWRVADPRIIVDTKANTGLADSLNVGIELCSCDWIARIDVDDIWHPDRLNSQVKCIEADQGINFLAGSMIELDEAGNRLRRITFPSQGRQLRRNLLSMKKFPPHSSVIFKKNLVERLGGYRQRIRRAEDHDLWLRVSEVTDLSCVNSSITYIRKHDSQISNDSGGLVQHRDALVSVVCAHARSLAKPEPVSLTDVEFSGYLESMDAHLITWGFYEFFKARQFLKRLSRGDFSLNNIPNVKDLIYFPYRYVFKYSYVSKIAKSILND